ncbi:unnamed protein product, partial [Polarella glacialis]
MAVASGRRSVAAPPGDALKLAQKHQVGGTLALTKDYTLLCVALGRKRLWQEALAAHSEMRRREMGPDVATFGAALGACARAQQWRKCLELLRSASRSEGLEPNVVLFSSALTSCEKAGEWEQAFSLLSAIRRHTLRLDVIACSATLSAAGEQSMWRGAVQLLLDMQRSLAVQPNAHSFNAAISGCEKGLQWARALHLLSEMCLSELIPDVFTYSAAVSACEKARRWEQALELLEVMRAQRVPPNAVSYSAAISACQKGQRADLAL